LTSRRRNRTRSRPRLLVGQQRYRQVVLLGERLEIGDRVVADPDHVDASLIELVPAIPEATRLGGTARRIGAGIEVDDDAAVERRERNRLSVLVLQFEVGCVCACVEHTEP